MLLEVSCNNRNNQSLGCKVIACGGDDDKLKDCIKKVQTMLNYKNNILKNELRLNSKEVNVIIDMVGGQVSLNALNH